MNPIGRYGEFLVSELFESKRFFVKIIENGKEKSIPVNVVKRYVQFSTEQGNPIVFKIYIHRGQMRWRDSRDKKGKSYLSPDECVSEAMRMLGISKDEAINIMSLYPQAPNSSAVN